MNNLSVRLLRCLLVLCVTLFARAARADEAALYGGTNWDFLDPKAEMAAAAAITPDQYPDCDDAVVDCRSERVYHADGTAEAQDDNYTKVLTEKGKRDNRTLSISFQLPYNTVTVVKLEVIKPDGAVVPVDVAANSKEAIDDSQMSENIYDPNSKILQVNIPQLEIGDVVHSIVRQPTQRSIIPGQYTEDNLFESESYIRHTSYEVRAPAERPLQCLALRDPVPGTVTYSAATNADQTLVYHWEVSNVPRMYDEPAMPAHANVLQRVLVSTLPDWPSVSKWYWNLSLAHLNATTPAMKDKVTELTAGATNDFNKVQDLFFFVSKKIRYMGRTPETDRPGFEPHDVCLTFDKKYGVCRDKAALLVSLLRIAGLPAYPVLINVGTKLDGEIPEPDFNHAIVCVELTNGVYTLMDPTDENTRQLLPAQDCNQSFLVCRPEGEQLKLSPIIPADQNLMHVTTTGELDNAGTLRAKTELLFDGVNDNEYRDAFAHMKPDDRRRFFERDLKRVMPGAELTSLTLLPENMLDISSPVRAQIEYTVKGMTATGSGKAIVSLPWVGKVFGIVNFILEGTGLEKRKYPLDTFVACGLAEKISIKLADGFTGEVSMPSSTPVDDAGLTYHRTVAFTDQSLECTRELNLKEVEFSPAQYLLLKKTLELMQYDDRKSPILAVSGNLSAPEEASAPETLPPVESNARILDVHKELSVQDAHSATYVVKYSKQILSYNGKVRESEIKVPFNPAVEDAKFLRGVVTSKTGQRQEISTNEISVMDQGWDASAKRYTGGKILVANLPGVDIGSTIEVEFTVASRGKSFLSGFEGFQLPDAMDQKTFDLTAPAGVSLHSFVSGQPGLVTQPGLDELSTNALTQHLEWQTKNAQALPAEQELPPDWTYAAGVGYFIGNASDYYQAVSDALGQHAAKNTQAAQLARQLAAKAGGQLATLTAIRDFIAQSIRDAGPNFTELPLSELSDADTTLADGYGHMADRAILFHAMLTAAGFQPQFVLASGLPPIAGITNVTAQLPLPQDFTAVLVKVSVAGETYYLNDTDQYAHLGATAYDGKLAIELPGQNFATVHAAADCQDKTDTVYGMLLDNSGKTRVEIARYYYGGDFGEKHHFFAELPPEERNRYFQEAVSDVAQGAQPVGGLTTDFTQYPGVEKFTVDINHYCVVDGKNMYFNLPFIPSILPPGADQRALPLFIDGAMDNTTRTEITLAPNFPHPVITPPPGELTTPDGSETAIITETNTAGKYVLTDEFKLAPSIVNPTNYPAMLKLETTLSKKSSRVFLLESE